MNATALFEPAFGAVTSTVLNGVFKASLMIAVALLLDLALRRQSAALRHRVWTAVFVALLVLPVAGYIVPAWYLPLVAAPVSATPGSPGDPLRVTDAAESRTEPGWEKGAGESQPASRATAVAAEAGRAVDASVSWGAVLAALWMGGTAFLLARLAYAIACAGRTTQRAAELVDDGWPELADSTRRHLGLAQPVRIAHSADVDMPMVWGIRRHTVLLPEDAADWSEERREVVLLHEMAHVQRGDCLAQLLSSTAAALHWFNPLVWIARRRQVAERELACDDAVLSSGTAGADYAWHLLEIARASGRAQPFSPAGVMMARKSQLEGRLLAVLDSDRDRRRVSPLGSLGVVVTGLLLVFPLAGLRPWAAPRVEAAEIINLSTAPVGEPTENARSAPPVRPLSAPRESEFIAELPQDTTTRERVIQMMIDLLHDEDARMRDQAVHSLGMMEDDRAVAALTEVVLADADASVRSQAAWALGMIESSNAVVALAQAVTSDQSGAVREQAAWALGMIESPEGVLALSQALSSEGHAGARSQAAWALGMIESVEGVSDLTAALQDSDDSVRSQAAWALGMIESSAAVDGLVMALSGDSQASVRSQAAWALGMIADDRAVEALIDAVEDENESVRQKALWAISQILG